MIRTCTFLLPLCLLFAVNAAPAREKAPAAPELGTLESVLTTQVNGWIVIDPQGQLTDIRIDTQIPDTLRTSLIRNSGKWRFHPVVVDGMPRTARARIRFVLAARKLGSDYRISVDNVLFPEGDEPSPGHAEKPKAVISAIALTPPKYPYGAQRAEISGIVLLGLKIGPDGSVQEVVPVQSSLLNIAGPAKVMRYAIRQFEQASIAAAKSWRFNVAAGSATTTPEQMTVMLPLRFTMQGAPVDKPGLWRTELRAPRQELTWLGQGSNTQKVGVSDLADGEVMPVASTMRLASDVIGKDLL